MIPAKISNLNPVQVSYKDPQDHRINIIADVENAKENPIKDMKLNWVVIIEQCVHFTKLELRMSCFIELTGEGKCRIVKLN